MPMCILVKAMNGTGARISMISASNSDQREKFTIGHIYMPVIYSYQMVRDSVLYSLLGIVLIFPLSAIALANIDPEKSRRAPSRSQTARQVLCHELPADAPCSAEHSDS